MEERDLPVGWAMATVGELTNVGPKNETADETEVGFVPLQRLGVTYLSRHTHEPRVWKEVKKGYTQFQNGDVLLARITPSFENGKAGIARDLPNGLGAGSTEYIVFRPFADALDPRYLLAHFKTRSFLTSGEMVMTGAVGQQRVPKAFVLESQLPLAPLNEQRRIAAKLDTTLAAVDACRQRLDGVAAILKRFRQAVLAAATSGELTREWREERGDFSHWQEKRLAELGEFGRGKSRHRPRNDPRLYGGDYPFIQTGDVANINGDWLTSHSQTYGDFGLAQSRIWPSTTLCITIAANIADTALLEYPACFPDSIVGFVADRTQVEPLIAKWMIDSVADKLESFAPATAQKNINLAILDKIVFSVPPLQEQTEIISRAQELFTLADQLEARLTAARKLVDRLTPALLAKAFRGELVPQDPNDEPASLLLERIRAARQADAAAGKSSGRGRKKAAALPDQLPLDAAPVPPDLLSGLLRECGALSERALLAASELDAGRFRRQLEHELKAGSIRDTNEEGKSLLEAVEAP